jgi:hypothetical protein
MINENPLDHSVPTLPSKIVDVPSARHNTKKKREIQILNFVIFPLGKIRVTHIAATDVPLNLPL